MFIKYYSAIEQPRVYGFLLHFQCIPTASTIIKRKMYKFIGSSDEDCFIEDNTIESRSAKKSHSRTIFSSGDRPYKKRLRMKKTLHEWDYR